MHAMPYGMKRAHWSLTYLAIHELRAQAESLRIPPLSDMTPARYDILFAIWQRPVWVTRGEDDTYRMSMGALVEKLGLHPSTVSKCVKGLVELGFVTREVAAHDARCRIVILTRLGLDMLECAKQVLFGRRDDFFFEANEVFAMTAAWNPARLARPVGEGDEDNMLIGVGQQAVACAAGLGSKACRSTIRPSTTARSRASTAGRRIPPRGSAAVQPVVTACGERAPRRRRPPPATSSAPS